MSVRSLPSLSLVAAGAVLLGPPILAQDVSGLGSFRDVASLEGIGGVALSPDGARVAYTVRSADWDANRFDTEIWVAGDGPPFQLTRTADGSSNNPLWSPDGRWVAFTADRGEGSQVHLMSPGGGEAFALTEMDGGVQDFAWAPDGSAMIVRAREEEAEEDRARVETYGEFTVEDAEHRMTHLWHLEVSDDGTASEPRRLTEGDFTVSDFRWSPSGDRVAFVRHPDPGINALIMGSDIWTLDVASGAARPLVEGPGPDASPVWSPDGQWVLFQEYTGELDGVFYRNRELARIPAGGGEVEILTSSFDEQPGGAVWTEEGILFAASEGTRRQLYVLDPDGGEIRELSVELPVVGSYDVSPGGVVAFTAQSGDQLTEVYRMADPWSGSGAAGAERLTRMTDQVDGWTTGSKEVISWESRDGARIEGVLHKPADYEEGARHPLLVVIHGGPTGTSRPAMVPGYVYPIAHWLAKGAVVLEPNYRGSAGYGEAFRSLNVENLGVGDMWDVMSGVDHLVDEGVADPERMGAMGWSQGGYISAFLTTNTDRFQAISVGAGISNWMTYYVNTDIHPFTRQYLKATPWDDPEIYARTSPMTNITDAATPTLIQHGEFDRRVPIPNAYELFQGLEDQGVEARLIVYKGFGHGIDKPKELLAAMWHNWQWFGEHIWGESIELPLDLEKDDPVTSGSPR